MRGKNPPEARVTDRGEIFGELESERKRGEETNPRSGIGK